LGFAEAKVALVSRWDRVAEVMMNLVLVLAQALKVLMQGQALEQEQW